MTQLPAPNPREPDLLAYPDACLCARLSLVELRRAIADGLVKVRALRSGGRTVTMVERVSLEAFARGRFLTPRDPNGSHPQKIGANLGAAS